MIDFEFDFRYEGEKIPALKNVQGEIGNGKCIVLCGGSGCGKSTLLRCINHLIPQFYEGNLKASAAYRAGIQESFPLERWEGWRHLCFRIPGASFLPSTALRK